jgi:hypothetical protein
MLSQSSTRHASWFPLFVSMAPSCSANSQSSTRHASWFPDLSPSPGHRRTDGLRAGRPQSRVTVQRRQAMAVF